MTGVLKGVRTRTVQAVYWLLTAVMVTAICLQYIPDRINALLVDRMALGSLSSQEGDHAVFLDGCSQLSVSFYPEREVSGIVWSSNNDSVASVDEHGVVTGNAIGTAVITATAEEGISTSMEVTVIHKPLPSDSDLPRLYYDKLIVANYQTPIGPDYVPELITVPSAYPSNHFPTQLTPETFEAYKHMFADAKAETGRTLRIISAYRSYQRQKELYDEDVAYYMARGYSKQRAQELTERSTNRPGCSEHQLGNSMDVGNGWSLEYNFGQTVLGKWVTEHAHEYGFILRYPADKTDKTGIDYEAWHFRYVGVEHATYIYEHDICLEEYVELQQQAEEEAAEYAESISATGYYSERYGGALLA